MLHDLLAALRRPGVLLGVHTCARLSPGGVALTTLGQARPDIIAFDAYQGLEVFCADPAAQDFHAPAGGWRGSRAHLAAVGADPQGAVCALAACATGVIAVEAVARQTLITATCGLGLLPEPAVAGRSTWPISSLSRWPRSHRQRPKRRRLGRGQAYTPQCLCTLVELRQRHRPSGPTRKGGAHASRRAYGDIANYWHLSGITDTATRVVCGNRQAARDRLDDGNRFTDGQCRSIQRPALAHWRQVAHR